MPEVCPVAFAEKKQKAEGVGCCGDRDSGREAPQPGEPSLGTEAALPADQAFQACPAAVINSSSRVIKRPSPGGRYQVSHLGQKLTSNWSSHRHRSRPGQSVRC